MTARPAQPRSSRGRATRGASVEKGKAAGSGARGIPDPGVVRPIYSRDPDGYVTELAAPTGSSDKTAAEGEKAAHDALERWQETKAQ